MAVPPLSSTFLLIPSAAGGPHIHTCNITGSGGRRGEGELTVEERLCQVKSTGEVKLQVFHIVELLWKVEVLSD